MVHFVLGESENFYTHTCISIVVCEPRIYSIFI